MALRLGAVLPRLVVVLIVFALGTATLTFAAAKRMALQAAPPAATPQQPAPLVVPDVRGQAYVFAKGILQDAGFAWHLGPGARGYAPYTVVSQSPAAGTRLVDTGAPTIVLKLARTKGYDERGHTPDDGSPYAGTAVRSAALASTLTPAKPAAPAKRAAKPKQAAPAAKPKPAAKKKTAARSSRPPAFHIAGAPKEPLDEMPLTDRAQRLAAWVAAHPRPTDANVRHWLYQHSWIVEGAKFGWWHGAQALRTLIAVDRRVDALWGIGARSEAEAQTALAFVQSRAG